MESCFQTVTVDVAAQTLFSILLSLPHKLSPDWGEGERELQPAKRHHHRFEGVDEASSMMPIPDAAL
jgi:hypothetical protein